LIVTTTPHLKKRQLLKKMMQMKVHHFSRLIGNQMEMERWMPTSIAMIMNNITIMTILTRTLTSQDMIHGMMATITHYQRRPRSQEAMATTTVIWG